MRSRLYPPTRVCPSGCPAGARVPAAVPRVPPPLPGGSPSGERGGREGLCTINEGDPYVAVMQSVCVCVCVCVCDAGSSIFTRSAWLDPYGHTGVLGSGRFPIIAGPRRRPGVLRLCVAPQPVRYALGPEPGSLPQDHPGSGVVAPWLLPGQLHGNSSTSPSSPCCPVCCVCIGASTAGGACGSEASSTAYSIWRFPQRGCVCVCVCVCDAQSFQQIQSVHYHISPLYSNVRPAAMFHRPPLAEFPPSLQNTKTMYSRSVPHTALCIPICLPRPLCREP